MTTKDLEILQRHAFNIVVENRLSPLGDVGKNAHGITLWDYRPQVLELVQAYASRLTANELHEVVGLRETSSGQYMLQYRLEAEGVERSEAVATLIIAVNEHLRNEATTRLRIAA